VHEAAHGWYGNGVRIACWEDFVLSEGTASYMATRATAQVLGRAAADKKREHVRASFERLHSSGATAIAWPEGCNGVDILKDGLFGPAPYVKGELFYEAVAQRIGVEALDAVLREFYLAHRGGAAHMDDMLALIEQRSGWNPRACAKAWLRSTDRPGPDAC
jgi:aminopeptidase N